MAIARRTWLKGVSLGVGSLLLKPILDRLHAEEGGVQQKPWRIVFVLQSNGFQPWAAQPAGIPVTETGPAKTLDLPLADYELPADLDPLKPYKQRVTILQRLRGNHVRPNHTALFGALSGVRGREATAQTIDAALARLNPATYPLVNLGVSMQGEEKIDNGIVRVCSAWDAGKPIGTQLDPFKAYQALFGEAAAKKLDEGGGIMDEIADDVRRVRKQLSAADREKFAQHLEAFETLDQRKELFRKAEGLKDNGMADPPTLSDAFSTTEEAKRLAAQFELAATALISGLTNVVTIASGACEFEGHFEGLGFDNLEMHMVGHMRAGDRTWQSIYTTLRQYHFKLIAGLIDRLNQTSDPDGTPLMDNTLIVYTSDGADAHHSNGRQWPFVLIGNLQGKLRSGRFLEFPGFGQPGNRPINALYSTLLHAAGQPRGTFNATPDAGPAEELQPLAELLS